MSATMTRRGLLSGAGKVAAVAGLATLPAAASLAGHPDAAIFAAFNRWRQAVAAYVASPLDSESAEWEAMIDAAGDDMDAVIDLQPQTLEGLAVKTWMALRFEYGSRAADEMSVDFSSGQMTDQSLPQSLAGDLLRLSPFLAAAVG